MQSNVSQGDALNKPGAGTPVIAGMVPEDPADASQEAASKQPAVGIAQAGPISEAAAAPGKKIRSAAIEPAEVAKRGKIRSISTTHALAKTAKKDYSAPVGKRLQTTYPIKSQKGKFIRVHPDASYRQMGVLTFEEPDTQDIYYVSPELEIPDSYGVSLRVTNLYMALTHDGMFFVWPVHRSETTWYRSAMKAVGRCAEQWLKVVARRGPNIYDLYTSEYPIPDPDWSALPTFDKVLEEAFEGRMIESLDHPVLRKARGYLDDAA